MSVRAIAIAFTFATGATGLVYEVTWQRFLATLLGSHSEATAAVLGLFLGGLALGYSFFGRLADRLARSGGRRRLVAVYGVVEASIGAYALIFPSLYRAAVWISAQLPSVSPGLDFGIDVGLSACLLIPPTMLMGSTIPLLTQALPRGVDDATRVHALVYGVNTIGAFLGALAGGFWLIPWLGLVGVLAAMAVVNFVAGAVYWLCSRRLSPEPLDLAPPDDAGDATMSSSTLPWAGAAALLGFAMMATQTVVIRLGGVSFGSSEFAFSTVVAAFVLCIAIGGLCVSGLRRVSPRWLILDVWGLAIGLGVIYAKLDEAPYWVHWVRIQFGQTPAEFLPYHAAGLALLLCVFGPALILSGVSLPLIFHYLRGAFGELGSAAGRLYAWNTLGSLAGALLAGYALLFWLDLHHVYRLAVGSVVVAAAIVTDRVLAAGKATAGWRRPTSAVAAALALALLASLPAWRPELLAIGTFRMRQPHEAIDGGAEAVMKEIWKNWRLAFYDDDPTLSAAAISAPSQGRETLSIVTNGKSDGNTLGDYRTMSLISVVPSLLAERVERGFVIGFGTGITAGELAALPGVKEVVVAEISSAVLEAAPLFDFANLGVSTNPKIELRRSDAYRALLRSEGNFDVILSEPSNPWTAGVEMLFSREYLEVARERLSPGGVYVQWMHQYETSAETLALVLRTYLSVFEHVSVWYTQEADILLVGFNDANVDPAVHLERIRTRYEEPAFQAVLSRAGFSDVRELLALELIPVGVLRGLDLRGPLHTLLHPRLGHVAGRAFFVGRAGRLPFTGRGEGERLGRENSLLQRYVASEGESEADLARLAREACSHRKELCVTLLAHWRVKYGDTPLWQNAVVRAKGTLRGFGGRVTEKAIRSVTPLFRDAGPIGAVPLARAQAATAAYRRFYRHGFPFDPERLRQVWARCQSPMIDPRACTRARAGVAGILGPPGVEGPGA